MLPITKGRRDASPISLDMMYKMDTMPTDRRDVHTDTFRHDAQDGHDAAGLVGMITTIF